jgi:hypothetical protein
MLGPTTAIPCAAAAKVLAKTYLAILDIHTGPTTLSTVFLAKKALKLDLFNESMWFYPQGKAVIDF